MIRPARRLPALLGLAAAVLLAGFSSHAGQVDRPNIVVILADDIGYGDLGCYGAAAVPTPNIDRLAREGIRFTSGYASSATCTPSRYSLLTGEYAFRKRGTGILAGDAGLIIEPGRTTLPSMLKSAGYSTAVVGKWHLGLGAGKEALDWNREIRPGPQDIGFDYSYLMPATGDRVPCVYVENGKVVNLDPSDPIQVSYTQPFPGEPTGVSHRHLLKLDWSHGHNESIVNGISRIGHMRGGRRTRWVDEEMADVFTRQATSFIERRKKGPFFLYFASHDNHVPRVPHPRFAGKTTMGPRGDAIVQFDWSVGEILKTLDRLGLSRNTLVVLSSDNGPVLDDGYKDQAVEKLGDHRPAGPLRGGKYSAFEGGTRVPFLVRWPGRIRPAISDAIVGQVDLLASFASLTGSPAAPQARDSVNVLPALVGKDGTGRDQIVQYANTLALRHGNWKYIEPSNRMRRNANTNTELGNDPAGQLYDLTADPGERTNLVKEQPAKAAELAEMLRKEKEPPPG